MQKHTKIYHEALGIYPGEAVSELSGEPADDIHHINSRGMGGTVNIMKDSIFNLMALTRAEHEKYGDKAKYRAWLINRHMRFLMQRGVKLLGAYNQVNFHKGKIEFIDLDDEPVLRK